VAATYRKETTDETINLMTNKLKGMPMDQSIDEMLGLDERNSAVLVGLMFGFFAGLFVALFARSNVYAQARQKVTGVIGEMDLDVIQSRMPDRLLEGTASVQDAFTAGRSRATDIVNQSPLPVTIGPDREADPAEAESETADLEDGLSQATVNRAASESRSVVSDE
jgi:hypothetical protein